MYKRILIAMIIIMGVMGSTIISASDSPALKKHVELEYDDTGLRLYGFVPALDAIVERAWELSRWDAVYQFSDGSKRTVTNYDVFNVKKKPDDPNFDRENGFGLVYKSQEALGGLFDSIMNGQTINDAQKKYYRDKFIQNADDPMFTQDHPFHYQLEYDWEFLRTSGILQRMGIRFTQTVKIGDDQRQAWYEVSKWPSVKATVNEKLVVNFSAHGYTERDLRLIAVPKGTFPDLSYVVSLTDNRLIHTDQASYSDTIQVDTEGIVSQLGREVDIILEDGYGRTAIQSVTLPDPPKALDFIPTDISYTDGGQVWLKWKYVGEDFKAGDYISGRGIPNMAKIKITGPETDQATVQSMYNSSIPAIVKNGDTFTHMIGKAPVGEKPGTYRINILATVNNPNHPERSYEAPVEAYDNNDIEKEFTVEVEEPPYDLIAQSIKASPSTITKGGKTTITAVVKNVGKYDQKDVLIRFTANGEIVYEARKNLPANTPQSVGPFQWTGSTEGFYNMTVHVDPEREKEGDTDPGNNIASTGCLVQTSRGSGSCGGDKIIERWSVTYPYIYRILPIFNPQWRTQEVEYREQLNISAAVNTKQGIATDLQRPKESDRESRGSWEIIPWSKNKGIDPNTVTRAGYGFEIKATTGYWTNWEKSVPEGLLNTAVPIGGEYFGPDEVTATIYNSKGDPVKNVKLEKTSGDRFNATWELPEQTVTSESGKTYRDRKFYTNINDPDGKYTVKIYTGAAGMHNLIACKEITVQIYGSMYDDVQNLRSY